MNDLHSSNKDFLHLLNTQSNCAWEAICDFLKLNPKQQHIELNRMLEETKGILQKNGIQYLGLRKLLTPYATFHIFVFDSCKIENSWYGLCIHEKITACLKADPNDKNSKIAFLTGDYLVNDFKHARVLKYLFTEANINVSNWYNATQYYIVGLINASQRVINSIKESFADEVYYCGNADLTTNHFHLKTYLTMTLCQHSIKVGKRIVFSVPDLMEVEQLEDGRIVPNFSFFVSDDYDGYTPVHVLDVLYSMFLSPRLQSLLISREEMQNALILLNPDLVIRDDYKIIVEPKKLKYIREHVGLNLDEQFVIENIKLAVSHYQVTHLAFSNEKESRTKVQFNLPLYHEGFVSHLAVEWDFEDNTIRLVNVIPS